MSLASIRAKQKRPANPGGPDEFSFDFSKKDDVHPSDASKSITILLAQVYTPNAARKTSI
jgi:hypothetical protein